MPIVMLIYSGNERILRCADEEMVSAGFAAHSRGSQCV